jgi:hypothetical protein
MHFNDKWQQANNLRGEATPPRLDPEYQPLVDSLRDLYHGLSEAILIKTHHNIEPGVLQEQLTFLTERDILAEKSMCGTTHYLLTNAGQRFLTPVRHLPKPRAISL